VGHEVAADLEDDHGDPRLKPFAFLSLALAAAATIAQAAAPAPPEGLPEGITARARADGWMLADERGMTLYTYDRDEATPGGSSCLDECAESWPPMLAAPGAQPRGAWSLVTRADGAKQWAFRGRPLYRYASDGFAGSVFGDGVDTVWHIAFRQIATPREVRIGATTLGEVLTDTRGRTLYVSQKDKPGKPPSCTRDCLRTWEPVVAPALANAFDDWSVVVRDDGLRQWAWKGQALYRRPGKDVAPGEISGHGVDGFGAVVLEPVPPLPPWATIQPSDAGELIANEQGITVYTHGLNARGRRRLVLGQRMCGDLPCIDPDWVPFIAAADAKPIGSWALVDLPDGRRQWAYKGQKLYTNKLDKKPGEFKGIRFGGDRSWSAIMRDGQPMQGVSVGG
jgi:predicted lipoprotein with Yx(FWY)xxD motif